MEVGADRLTGQPRSRTAALDEDARTDRILRWIIRPTYALLAVALLFFLGLGVSARPELTILFHGAGLLVVVAADVLRARGRLSWASDLLIALFFVLYFVAALLSGGTTSPYMGGFMMVVVGAALLRGGRVGLAAAGVCIAASALFTALAAVGVLPPSLMPLTPMFNFVAWGLFLGMAAILLNVTIEELQGALYRAERTEVALEGALDDLRATSISKESVERVLLGLGDAVFVLDADERIRDVNTAATRILARSREALIGQPFTQLLEGELPDGAQTEGVLLRPNGRVHVSLSRAPLVGMRGQVDGDVIVAHDIQARVASEAAQHAAIVAAEQASRAKSTFLATMSHELRTPLNAIIGYAEFVQEELEDDPALGNDVGRIASAGQDLLALINDVLDLSKIEAGRLEAEIRDVDLLPLIEDVRQQVRPLIDRNRNTMQVQVDGYVGPCRTDPTRVRQILRNLLSNAAKFTADGTVQLRVTVDGRWVRMAVQDSGIGMSPEQLGLVFEPFRQASASTTRRYGGTGLGLSITKHLCELLGGDIEASSVEGEGSCFTVALPMRVGGSDVHAHRDERR